jgi:hypothetical protein
VVGDLLARPDRRHLEPRPFPDGGRIGVGDHPELGPRLSGEDLHLQPVGEARLVCEQRRNLR